MTPEQRVAAGVCLLRDVDAGELLTLQLAAWVREQHDNPGVRIPPLHETLDDVRTQLADPELTIWGLREHGRLLATVRTSSTGPLVCLGRLGVVPDLYRQGLGAAMLRHAETRLPPTIERIELITGARSVGNHAFYARNGYAITGPGPADGTLLMAKTVPTAKNVPASGVDVGGDGAHAVHAVGLVERDRQR